MSVALTEIEKETAAEKASRPTSDERRQALVVAAFEIIAAQGFEGLRVREVAARVGINIATLHYYFPAKEDLVRGVVDYLVQQFTDRTAPDAPNDTPLSLRRELADLEFQLRTTPALFVVLTELELRSLREPAVHSLLARMNDGWRAHLENVCRAEVAAGRFRPDLDLPLAASLLAALLKGVGMQTLGRFDHFDFERIRTEIERGFQPPAPSKGEIK